MGNHRGQAAWRLIGSHEDTKTAKEVQGMTYSFVPSLRCAVVGKHRGKAAQRLIGAHEDTKTMKKNAKNALFLCSLCVVVGNLSGKAA